MFPVLWFINLYEMRQLNLTENLRFYNNLVITLVIHLYSMSLNIFFLYAQCNKYTDDC